MHLQVSAKQAGCRRRKSGKCDHYKTGRARDRAAVLASGVNIGAFLAFLIGGFVGQRYGWRTAFIVGGLPPVLCGLLLWLTTREGRRSRGP